MKKIFTYLIIIASVVMLFGCRENTPTQTVDWYKIYDAERTSMITKCKANSGALMASPNCINAQQANNEKINARRGWLVPDAVDFSKKGG